MGAKAAAWVKIATEAQGQGLPTEGTFELAVAQVASRFAGSKSDDDDDDDGDGDNDKNNDNTLQ